MLGQRRRRWANIKPVLFQGLVFVDYNAARDIRVQSPEVKYIYCKASRLGLEITQMSSTWVQVKLILLH